MFGTQVRYVFAILLYLYFKVSAIWYDETGIESLKKEEVGWDLCISDKATLLNENE